MQWHFLLGAIFENLWKLEISNKNFTPLLHSIAIRAHFNRAFMQYKFALVTAPEQPSCCDMSKMWSSLVQPRVGWRLGLGWMGWWGRISTNSAYPSPTPNIKSSVYVSPNTCRKKPHVFLAPVRYININISIRSLVGMVPRDNNPVCIKRTRHLNHSDILCFPLNCHFNRVCKTTIKIMLIKWTISETRGQAISRTKQSWAYSPERTLRIFAKCME